MSYVDWIEQLPREFWLSALFGSFATVLYAINEFARPTFAREPDKPETSFAPAELTSGSDYLVSFCIYLAGLLAVYWLICLIGPAPFASAGLTGDADVAQLEVPGAFPLWVAMILIGVFPRLPVFSYFEQAWRKLMHTRARIPQTVLVRSSDLRRAEFSFAAFEGQVRRREGIFARHVDLADLEAPPTTPSHRWARLSAVLQQLSTIDAHPVAARFVDSGFLDRNRTMLAAITADYLNLADRVNRTRRPAEPLARPGPVAVIEGGAMAVREEAVAATAMPAGEAKAAAVSDEYGEQIEALLRRTCLFLACAMLATPEATRDPDEALRAFGFRSVPASDVTSEVDVVIKALLVAFLVYCVYVFIAFRIGPALPASMGETGWPLPGMGNDRLQFIVTFALPQFAAIVGALMLRHAFRRKRMWFRGSMRRPAQPAATKYILVTALSFALALLVSSYLAGTWQGAQKILDDLHWRFFEGFVPAVSALCVCLAIDGVLVDWSARQRVALAGFHAVMASIVAFGAAEHFYTNDRNLDFTGAVLYSTFGTAVYATTLAVAVLLLATRSALIRAGDETPADD